MKGKSVTSRKKKTTPKEFANKLKEIQERRGDLDDEGCHSEMESAIIALLEELGYIEGAEIFRNQPLY